MGFPITYLMDENACGARRVAWHCIRHCVISVPLS